VSTGVTVSAKAYFRPKGKRYDSRFRQKSLESNGFNFQAIYVVVCIKNSNVTCRYNSSDICK